MAAETPVDWYERCREFHQQGLDQIKASKYSEVSLMFNLQIWKTDQSLDWHCLAEGLTPEGRVYLMLKSMEMRKDKAVAAIFQADMRSILLEEFTKHFQIKDPIDSPEWDAERLRIVRAHGGDYGKLPRNTWQDVISTGVKGPEIPSMVIRSPYSGDANDQVVIGETEELITSENVVAEFRMLPDWWGNTIRINLRA